MKLICSQIRLSNGRVFTMYLREAEALRMAGLDTIPQWKQNKLFRGYSRTRSQWHRIARTQERLERKFAKRYPTAEMRFKADGGPVQPPTPSQPFTGQIDSVKLYTIPLTPDDIHYVAMQPEPPEQADLPSQRYPGLVDHEAAITLTYETDSAAMQWLRDLPIITCPQCGNVEITLEYPDPDTFMPNASACICETCQHRFAVPDDWRDYWKWQHHKATRS